MTNRASLLEGSAQTYPAREALVLGETCLTHAQVNRAAAGQIMKRELR